MDHITINWPLLFQADSRIILSKLISKYPPDIDASVLLKILKGHWKAYLIEKPSLELCRHLVMLRDYNISGRINLMEIPVLLHMLHFWKVTTSHHVSFISPKFHNIKYSKKFPQELPDFNLLHFLIPKPRKCISKILHFFCLHLVPIRWRIN